MKRLWIPLICATLAAQTGTNVKDTFTSAPPDGVKIEKFVNLTTAPLNMCLDGASVAQDCWIDMLIVSVTAATDTTVVATNGDASFVLANTNASFPTGRASIFMAPGGMKFVGGLILTAGANTAVNVYVRGTRNRGAQ